MGVGSFLRITLTSREGQRGTGTDGTSRSRASVALFALVASVDSQFPWALAFPDNTARPAAPKADALPDCAKGLHHIFSTTSYP